MTDKELAEQILACVIKQARAGDAQALRWLEDKRIVYIRKTEDGYNIFWDPEVVHLLVDNGPVVSSG